METTGTQTATPQTSEQATDETIKTQASPQGEAGQTGNAIKDAAAEAKRRLKIDNEEVDEEEVFKTYRARKEHQRAANKSMQEGLKAKRQAEEFISMMKDKGALFDTIKKLGHDPRKLAEEYLAEALQDEMADPRDRELKEYKSKLKAYEDEKKKLQEETDKKLKDDMKAKFSEDYSKQFVEALKTSGLPPTKAMVAEMAKYIKRAAEVNFEMTAVEAAKMVKEDMEKAYQNLYGEADAETLVRLLGDQGLQKVRTFDTSRLKDPSANLKTPETQGEPNRQRGSRQKRMTTEQWREFNRGK